MDTVAGPSFEPFSSSLFKALGDYWSRLYTDSDLIEKISDGNGLAAAQTYLEFVETVLCLDRQNMPAYHREMYIPIVLRLSERNSGQAIKIGQTPTIAVGPQAEESGYREGDIFSIGGPAAFKGTLSYPVNSIDFDKGVESLHNNLFNPTDILAASQDFYIDNGSLFIRQDKDPFESDKYAVRTIRTEDGGEDIEILLWGTNALVDKDLVYDHYGYAVGRFDKDPEAYLRQVNTLWDLQFVGTDIQVVKKAAADLVSVPSIKEDGEILEVVTAGQDGEVYAVTDKNSYRVDRPDTLLPHIVPGTVFKKGDYLTDALKVYWNLDTQRFVYPSNDKITLSSFVKEVPSLHIPKAVAGNYSADSGVIVTWGDTPLTYEGLDANGNWKIRFDMRANFGKIDLYWEEVWQRAEDNNVDLAEIFAEYITLPAGVLGGTVGSINPMQYYMDNFLKANATIITVNFDSLPDSITSLRALTRLKSAVPAHTLLIILGRLSVSELPYDLTDTGRDAVNVYEAKNITEEANVHGAASNSTNLTYRDGNLQTKWIRRC